MDAMDKTFIAILDLSYDANILFASDSITEILGYEPQEVKSKSSFSFFHPDEVPFARSIHKRGILLDKAAALHYARVVSRSGDWIGCECCFTVVYDVLVASVSIYRRDEKSQKRAVEAPQISRLFSSSGRDPRYHMLQHLSPKFRMPVMEREPRAALILNRFTRSLGIMFSTDAVASVLGLLPEHIQYRSFYECIQESSLHAAVSCLEDAKANDSIAYLRFWSRDPRRPEDLLIASSEDDESRPYRLAGQFPAVKTEDEEADVVVRGDAARETQAPVSNTRAEGQDDLGNSNRLVGPSMFEPMHRQMHSLPAPDETSHSSAPLLRRCRPPFPVPSVELEAVVSCTSDGLVVVLRKARPMLSSNAQQHNEVEDAVFAAPWAAEPSQTRKDAPSYRDNSSPTPPSHMPGLNANTLRSSSVDQLMTSIRDVAVFAWAVVGINETMALHSSGQPMGNSQPGEKFPDRDVSGPDGNHHESSDRSI